MIAASTATPNTMLRTPAEMLPITSTVRQDRGEEHGGEGAAIAAAAAEHRGAAEHHGGDRGQHELVAHAEKARPGERGEEDAGDRRAYRPQMT